MEVTLAAIGRDHRLIRVLFNNATRPYVPPDQFDNTISVNVDVPSFATQWMAKRLIAAGEIGAIHRLGRRTAR
jgi:hypothetical protein